MTVEAKSMLNLIQKLKDPLYKNSIFLMLSTFVGSALGFIYWIVAARLYSVEAVGIATALISAMNLIAAFSKLGFDIGLVKFLPCKDERYKLVNLCIFIVFVFSVFLSIIFVLGLDIWSHPLKFLKENVFVFISFIIFVSASANIQILYYVFLAYRKAKFSFIQNILWFTLKLILIVFFVNFGSIGIFMSWGIAVCLGLFLSYIIFILKLESNSSFKVQMNINIIKEIFIYSFGNYIAQNLFVLTRNILPLLVISVLGPSMSAYFYVAWSVAFLLFAIPGAVSMVLFTEGSYDIKSIKSNNIKAIKFTFAILLPAILITIIFGDKILLIFGKNYSENAFNLLIIFALSGIPFTFIEFKVATERAEGKIRSVILYYGLIAIFTILLSYPLMISLKLLGVGISWFIAQCIVTFLNILEKICKRCVSS
jgi:O-antigen/teichoic acid export membrane protein